MRISPIPYAGQCFRASDNCQRVSSSLSVSRPMRALRRRCRYRSLKHMCILSVMDYPSALWRNADICPTSHVTRRTEPVIRWRITSLCHSSSSHAINVALENRSVIDLFGGRFFRLAENFLVYRFRSLIHTQRSLDTFLAGKTATSFRHCVRPITRHMCAMRG